MLPTPDPNVPTWAGFFEKTEYLNFLEELDLYFKLRGLNYEVESGVVTVSEREEELGKLGLTNIAQICKQHKIEEYGELITVHLDGMLGKRESDKKLMEHADDFRIIRDYVAIRLHNIDSVSIIGRENLIGFPVAGDIFAMLVFDLPESIVNVQRKHTEAWDKTDEELIELGIHNARERNPVEVVRHEFGGNPIYFVSAEHFFSGNFIFDLPEHPELIGWHGTLVGIPNRHTTLFFPINDIGVLDGLNRLLPTVYGMHQEGPGSLSDKLFWYHEGEYLDLPYEVANGQLSFSPPATFVELLNRLADQQ